MNPPAGHPVLRIFLALSCLPAVGVWLWLLAALPGSTGWGRGFVEAFLVMFAPAAAGGVTTLATGIFLPRRPLLWGWIGAIGAALNVVTTGFIMYYAGESLGPCFRYGEKCGGIEAFLGIFYIALLIFLVARLWQAVRGLRAPPPSPAPAS
jgi:hypothetical protein